MHHHRKLGPHLIGQISNPEWILERLLVLGLTLPQAEPQPSPSPCSSVGRPSAVERGAERTEASRAPRPGGSRAPRVPSATDTEGTEPCAATGSPRTGVQRAPRAERPEARAAPRPTRTGRATGAEWPEAPAGPGLTRAGVHRASDPSPQWAEAGRAAGPPPARAVGPSPDSDISEAGRRAAGASPG